MPPMEDSKPLYNSRIVDTYVKHIRKNYPHVNIGELLAHAGITAYEVADEGHWFSQEQINRFHEKLFLLTGNHHIAREAGRYAASPETSGVMRQYLLGLLGPAKAYDLIGKASSKFTRASTFQSRKIASNRVEITVTPRPGVIEQPFQCENRAGFLEAVAMIFSHKLPRIEHRDCAFRGARACRYIVSWETGLSDRLKQIRNAVLVAIVLANATGIWLLPLAASGIALTASLFLVLILMLLAEKQVNVELKKSLENLNYSTDRLLDQIDITYNNARLANEIGMAISVHTKIDDILSSVVQISQNRLDYDRCLILLANFEKTRLEYRAGYGYTRNQLELLKATAFHLDRPDATGVFVTSFHRKTPFLVNNLDEIEQDLSLRSLMIARKMGTQSFICCPILCGGNAIGVLAVDNVKSKKPLVQSDISLLVGLASVIGISIHNVKLLEGGKRQFRSILQTLVASIDARDPLTAGHSETVTQYAQGICAELGLSEDYREMIGVAALLHDYGKIGIPDAVLKKTGRLTAEEFEIVKTHSEKTRQILEQISFEGIYSQVPEIAGSHHEYIDGTGYPHGLKHEAIPLGARIVAVADFFDAITARRPYRDQAPHEFALQKLRAERGKRFDPEVVDAFCRYFQNNMAAERLAKASSM
jgi:HD-GYP domain-containing protein (c-di-GMP phosphodiesterase class II)